MINAADLIGTKHLPPRHKLMDYEARRARAYFNLNPYPGFSFGDWVEEERGPLPRCRPFVRTITARQARWLMGKGLEFAADEDTITDKVNEVWAQNRMNTQVSMIARNCGQAGTIFLKYTYDEENKQCPVRISVLDGVRHVRAYYDPHDSTQLLMVRIQYPYWDTAQGKWYWFREDITADQVVTYEPKYIPGDTDQGMDATKDPYSFALEKADTEVWAVQESRANEFGVINGALIKNLDEGGQYGRGDLWGLWPTVDQLNHSANLAHIDNQRGVWPREVYIDAGNVTGPTDPTQQGIIAVDSENPENQAKVQQLTHDGTVRVPLWEHYKELRQELYDVVGMVIATPDMVTNKGNLTRAVMSQVYLPLIELTGEKRETYGENGICKFLEAMCEGLSNLGVDGWKGGVDVQAVWPDYFDLTEEDLKLMTERQVLMVTSGFTTRERAAKDLALAEGREDYEELLDEIEKIDVQLSPPGGVTPEDNQNGSNQKAAQRRQETAGRSGSGSASSS